MYLNHISEDDYSKLEKAKESGNLIKYSVLKPVNDGFIIQLNGMVGFVDYVHFAWKYKKPEYWEYIKDHITKKQFLGKIHNVFKNPYKLIINGSVHRFKTPILERKKKYNCIIINRFKTGLLVEAGVHFNWEYGSVLGQIEKNELNKDLADDIFKEGNIMELYYSGKESNQQLYFTAHPKSNNEEAQHWKDLNLLRTIHSSVYYYLNNKTTIEFKISAFDINGFLSINFGLFAKVSFIEMPWSYSHLNYWHHIKAHLLGLVFNARIIRFDPYHQRLSCKLLSNNTGSIQFVENQQYYGIIIDSHGHDYIIEFGYHFNWEYGSIMARVKKYLFQDLKAAEKEYGSIVDVYFYKNRNEYPVFYRKEEQKFHLFPLITKRNYWIWFLEERKAKIKKAYLKNTLIKVRIEWIGENEIYVNYEGIYGKSTFNQLPWQYDLEEYWHIILPHLKKVSFYTHIKGLASKYALFYTDLIRVKYNKPADLELKNQFTAIVLKKMKNKILVESGISNEWVFGSELIEINKNDHNILEWVQIEVGQKISIDDKTKKIFFETNTSRKSINSFVRFPILNNDSVTIIEIAEENVLLQMKNLLFSLHKSEIPVNSKNFQNEKSKQFLLGHSFKFDPVTQKILKPEHGISQILNSLSIGNKYRSVILDKDFYYLYVDIGYHFYWQYGSLIVNIPSYHFEDSEYEQLEVGTLMNPRYFGANMHFKSLVFGIVRKIGYSDVKKSTHIYGVKLKIEITEKKNERLYKTLTGLNLDISKMSEQHKKIIKNMPSNTECTGKIYKTNNKRTKYYLKEIFIDS
jgi:hypothetical protein